MQTGELKDYFDMSLTEIFRKYRFHRQNIGPNEMDYSNGSCLDYGTYHYMALNGLQ